MVLRFTVDRNNEMQCYGTTAFKSVVENSTLYQLKLQRSHE